MLHRQTPSCWQDGAGCKGLLAGYLPQSIIKASNIRLAPLLCPLWASHNWTLPPLHNWQQCLPLGNQVRNTALPHPSLRTSRKGYNRRTRWKHNTHMFGAMLKSWDCQQFTALYSGDIKLNPTSVMTFLRSKLGIKKYEDATVLMDHTGVHHLVQCY